MTFSSQDLMFPWRETKIKVVNVKLNLLGDIPRKSLRWLLLGTSDTHTIKCPSHPQFITPFYSDKRVYFHGWECPSQDQVCNTILVTAKGRESILLFKVLTFFQTTMHNAMDHCLILVYECQKVEKI